VGRYLLKRPSPPGPRAISRGALPVVHARRRGPTTPTRHGLDELATARQIRQEIKDDNDIINAFDTITYSKGSAVLEMFERWVGPEVFRKGIGAYLSQHRFGAPPRPICSRPSPPRPGVM